jgi:hypothetical protein
MSENVFDRLTIDLVVTNLENANFWLLARESWRACLAIVNEMSRGSAVLVSQRLLVFADTGIEVRRDEFEELARACEALEVVTEYMFLSARPDAIFGFTGVTFYLRPIEGSVAMTVRGYDRTQVELSSRLLQSRLLAAPTFLAAAGGFPQVTLEPMTMSTTNVMHTPIAAVVPASIEVRSTVERSSTSLGNQEFTDSGAHLLPTLIFRRLAAAAEQHTPAPDQQPVAPAKRRRFRRFLFRMRPHAREVVLMVVAGVLTAAIIAGWQLLA